MVKLKAKLKQAVQFGLAFLFATLLDNQWLSIRRY